MDVKFEFAPLRGQWPRPRTPFSERRKSGVFQATYEQTVRRLEYECGRLDARGPVRIQADFKESEIRVDGMIRSNAATPKFPGVIVNITGNRVGPQRFLCDDCRDWKHNLHAIALTLERLRLIDLYGVTKDAEQYKGFLSLPAPSANHAGVRTLDQAISFFTGAGSLADISGEADAAQLLTDPVYADQVYKNAARRLHPDAGGDPEKWMILQAAWAIIRQAHEARQAQEGR